MAAVSKISSVPTHRVNILQIVWLLILVLLLGTALFALVVAAVRTGQYELTTEQVLRVLFLDEDEVTRADRIPYVIVHELRLPRALLGAIVGGAMALAGVMLQDSMRNVLAEPGLLGVSSGAVLVVATVTVFTIEVPAGYLPWYALVGGMAAGSILLVAATLKMDAVRLILIGAAITAFLNALLIIIISLGKPFDVQVLYRFLVGSLANRTWEDVDMVLPWVVVCAPLALLTARPLNLLQLGDEIAEGLGLPVVRARVFIFGVSIALVSAVISVAGPISFISLLAPHTARRMLQTTDARRVLPVAGLIGAVLLTGADLFARWVYAPIELPVGLFTVIFGAPVLLLLIRRELARKR
jgi:iron complex transport system permease protein